MKSKLTFLAVLMAAVLVVVSTSDAFASRTRMQSLAIADNASPYIFVDSQHWTYMNPAVVVLLPGFLSFAWGSENVDDASAIWNGSGAANLKLNKSLTMAIHFDTASESLRDTENGMLGYAMAGTNVANAYATNNAGNVTPFDTAVNMLFNMDAAGTNVVPYPLFANGSLTFGIKIGRMNLGVQGQVVYTDDTMDDGSTEYTYQQYEPRVAVGIFMPFSATMFLDASFYASIPVLNWENKDAYTYTGVGYDMSILARFTMMASRKDMLHFWFKFRTYDGSTAFESQISGDDEQHDFLRTGHVITIGMSDEIKFAPNAFVFVGFDMDATIRNYDFSGQDSAGVDTTAVTGEYLNLIASIRFGVEAPLVAGLKGRLGMSHKFVAYESSTVEVDDGSDPETNTNNGSYVITDAANGDVNYESNVGVGLAWQLGQFQLEFNLNKQIFATGPFFLVGQTAGTNDALCTDVTFTYIFPAEKSAPAASNEE